MVTRKKDEINSVNGGAYGRGLRPDDRVRLQQTSSRDSYREVAFVAGGKGRHGFAAQERAVWLVEKDAVNLTPLDRPTGNLWRGHYDLVIAGSEEPWGLRDRLLGNTERSLLRYSPSDVLIVIHRPLTPSGRVVVAIDPDSMDRDRTLLASETIQAAIAFTNSHESELHVVNVVPSSAYYRFGINAGLSFDEAQGLAIEAGREQQRSVDRVLEGFGVDRDRMRVHLLQGNPVEEIANLVWQLAADLLVIGSIGRRGIGRLLIGNAAEKVMRDVSCSVLVVKPSRSRRGRSSRLT